MKQTDACLTNHQIYDLAEHVLSPTELAEIEDHLSGCETCRDLLGTATADANLLNELRDALTTETETGSAVDSDLGSTGWSLQDLPRSLEQVIGLLAPTDDPRMLGRLGTYEIVGVLGRGGMGLVLKGFDAALHRYVAIKMLAPHLAASGGARKRFEREARAAAAVVDDHVMAIHGVSEWQGVPYLVMPYIRGVSLQRRVDEQGALGVREILRIGMQTASGLAAAHAQGLVHRDVKPANILLTEGLERVTLTDFGLARAVDDASLTRTGVVAGTPQYMSPEQARGRNIDFRSDLFSLGSVMYAVCTGRPPFRAENSYGILRLITDEEPQRIRDLNPDIPTWLCEVVSRLMAKFPEQRYANAREVADLLAACLAHVEQPDTMPLPASLAKSFPRRIWSGNSKWRGIWAGIAVVGCVLLGMFGLQATSPPDIQGDWTGEDWGRVVLTKSNDNDGEYTGTYTDTHKSQPGNIKLKWSRIETQFNGTWNEGEERLGELSIRLSGQEILGAQTTDAKSKINPATPRLAGFKWTRTAPEAPHAESPAKAPAEDPNAANRAAAAIEDLRRGDDPHPGWFRADPYPQIGVADTDNRDWIYVRLANLDAAADETGIGPAVREKIAGYIKIANLEEVLPPRPVDQQTPENQVYRGASSDSPWRTARRSVDDLLQPVQRKRLEQLLYQKLGFRAFTQDDVARALELTPEQSHKIRTAIREHASRVQIFQAEIGIHKLGLSQPQAVEIRMLTSERNQKGVASHHLCWNVIYEILTSVQRTAFEALRGPAIDDGTLNRKPLSKYRTPKSSDKTPSEPSIEGTVDANRWNVTIAEIPPTDTHQRTHREFKLQVPSGILVDWVVIERRGSGESIISDTQGHAVSDAQTWTGKLNFRVTSDTSLVAGLTEPPENYKNDQWLHRDLLFQDATGDKQTLKSKPIRLQPRSPVESQNPAGEAPAHGQKFVVTDLTPFDKTWQLGLSEILQIPLFFDESGDIGGPQERSLSLRITTRKLPDSVQRTDGLHVSLGASWEVLLRGPRPVGLIGDAVMLLKSTNDGKLLYDGHSFIPEEHVAALTSPVVTDIIVDRANVADEALEKVISQLRKLTRARLWLRRALEIKPVASD